MGYAIRTDRYRYVEWRDWETGEVEARELYDENEDPGETRNLLVRHSPEGDGGRHDRRPGWDRLPRDRSPVGAN